ncbi:tyrosine-type recombinase/integrase [Gordonibacter sp.]|uniref:tyrosine-type recombinase/integrase n=1 Tax=Gordonibacter sp. TaxID=1968902 RepID=UPI003FA553BB
MLLGQGRLVQCAELPRWWRPWRTERGFDGLKFHELRHTQATQLLANCVDVKTVQNWLGRSDAFLGSKFWPKHCCGKPRLTECDISFCSHNPHAKERYFTGCKTMLA